MFKCNGKISTRQVFALFVLLTLSPAIRIFPSACAQVAKQAAWLAPILAVVPFIALYRILAAYFRKSSMTKLSDVFDAALGAVGGKILLFLYLVWCVILFWLYIRYYSGRLLASIFPNTDMRFFLLVMLVIVFIAARGSLETFVRFSEFLFPVFVVILIILSVFLLPEVKLANVWPVTYLDTVPVLLASVRVSALWGYVMLPFFFGDSIADKGQIKRYGRQAAVLLVIVTAFMLFTNIGALGYTVAARMPLPFFSAVKLITFIEAFDRFESLLLAIWVASDFVLICFFALTIMHILRCLFPKTEPKYYATSVTAAGYIGSQYLACGRFELEVFTSKLAEYVNLFLFFAVPFLVLIIGKMRKKL